MSSDAKPSGKIIEEQKPALSTAVKIREVRDKMFNFYYLLVNILLTGSCVASIFLILLVSTSSSSRTDTQTTNILIRVIVILVIVAIVSGVASWLVIKTKSKKKTITSLLPNYKETFIATEEGIYAMKTGNNITGTKYMLLHPWNSLSLFALNEKKKLIGLKAGSTLLKLSAPLNFTIMKNIILEHLPENARVIPRKGRGIRWGMLAGSLGIIFVIWFIAGQYYDSITRGIPGDHRCDICHKNLRVIFGEESYVVESGETTIHEYCWQHGLIYAIIHPAMGTESLIRTIKSEGFDGITHVASLSDLVWLYVIGMVIQLSLPRWLTIRTLKQ
jgi:hypothetical protein